MQTHFVSEAILRVSPAVAMNVDVRGRPARARHAYPSNGVAQKARAKHGVLRHQGLAHDTPTAPGVLSPWGEHHGLASASLRLGPLKRAHRH